MPKQKPSARHKPDYSALENAKTDEEKLVAMNNIVQSIHFAHNEVRRLVPQMLDIMVRILATSSKAAGPKKTTQKKTEADG